MSVTPGLSSPRKYPGAPIIDPSRRQHLAEFVDWCNQHVTGDEKGEAQIFLDRLFQAFSQRGCLDVGGTPEFRIRKGHEDSSGTAFADYVWKPIVLIEMKKRGADLTRHYRQAFDYWVRLAPNRPRYVILCNFDEFRIYDFNVDIDDPADTLTLAELPDRYPALAFLYPTLERPTFRVDRLAVTQAAADLLATCYNKLAARQGVGPQTAQRFILQILVALFSEDIGLLPKAFVTQLLDECTDPPKAFDLLSNLFRAMNTPGGVQGGRFKNVPYFNGGLFANPAPVELYPDEQVQLRRAAEYDWSHVKPEIFGTIFQHSLLKEERHRFGGHFTSPIDIMKIVGPTIVEPWRTAIDSARSVDELRGLQHRLWDFKVLDPACGSGNFLYIAYRELKRLEAQLLTRIREVAPSRDRAQGAFGFVTSKQFFGMDILPFAIELAKVTMTVAHKLAIDELHIEEQALPLDNLDHNFLVCDALITRVRDASYPPLPPVGEGKRPTGRAGEGSSDPSLRTPWPVADVIIGNPPFLGAKRLKPERGADYVNALRKAYPEVPGMADYCVYWIRRAQDHLPACTPDDPLQGRAGLVGTQNIRNNQSRVGGLDHVVATGGIIVEAVENQPWSGEANVHVSIVNWVKTQPSSPFSPRSHAGQTPTEAQDASANASDARREDTPAPKDEHHVTPAPKNQDLLIPARKKLWHKVDSSKPLFETAAPGHPSTVVTGKRGRTRKDKSYELAYRETNVINSTLSDQIDVTGAEVLRCNTAPQKCFNGQFPRHSGFVISPEVAQTLLSQDQRNSDVVHPFLIGSEMLTKVSPERWVIDFQKRDILSARGYPRPFAIIEGAVLPHVRAYAETEHQKTGKATGQDQNWLQTWWQHFRCRKEMVDAISSAGRYIACSDVTKRPIFVFVAGEIRPDHKLRVFAFPDDYSFGILQSDTHWLWFVTKCSKLKSDFNYTAESVFDTFPWPQGPAFTGPADKDVEAVAQAGREIRRVRAEALTKIKGGLRGLYRTLELPGKNPLKDAHAALDAAVLRAYGFAPKADILKQLLDLNTQVAQRLAAGQPVVSPGVPPGFAAPQGRGRGPAALITDDCIRPQ